MRISIVHSFYRSGPSGENIAVRMQAEALAQAGHEVQIIGAHTDERVGKPGYRLKAGFTVATGFGESPLAAIRGFEPDIVHLHNLFPNWGTRWIRDLNFPSVASLHNFRPLCAAATMSLGGAFCERCPALGSHHAIANSCYQNSRVKTLPLAIASAKPNRNPLFKYVTGFVFLSSQSAEVYERHIPILREKPSLLAPNFSIPTVAPGHFNPPSPEQPWLFVGRLSEEKGIIPLIESWPSDQELLVAGSGPLGSEARKAARAKPVRFLGEVTRSEVDVLLNTSRALVFPSICMETLGLTVAEAFGLARPVAAKAGNVPAFLVAEADAGAVFETFEELPSTLHRITNSLERHSKAARKLHDITFSRNAWLAKLQKFFEQVA